ncbi:Sensor histidine kinase DesK [Cellulomonas hominis]|nr:Sensor histidine kinase DesK [Cellulomonas hominis]
MLAGMPSRPATAAVAEPPRLGGWSRTWRYLVAIGTGLLLWMIVVIDLSTQPGVEDDGRVGAAVLLDLVVGVLSIGLLPLRRRYPVVVAAVLAAATAVSSFAAGPAILALVSLSTRRRWREVLPVAGLWFAAGLVYELVYQTGAQEEPPSHLMTMLVIALSVLGTALVIATGFYIGTRRELVRSLELRAEAAEHAQESRAEQARQAERTRIAREMHDVLAHRISLVAMQAGALAYREDLTREQITQSAETIRDSAHQALGELREVLGVLRTDGGSGVLRPGQAGQVAVEAPQPTLAELPALLADSVEAGGRIQLDTSGLPGGDLAALAALPGTTSRTAFRVLQEALTNARKHAPGQEVRVRLAGVPGERLLLEARNLVPATVPAAVPGAGLGLVGAAERADLLGGSLEHGVERDGTFAMRVWLPWPS